MTAPSRTRCAGSPRAPHDHLHASRCPQPATRNHDLALAAASASTGEVATRVHWCLGLIAFVAGCDGATTEGPAKNPGTAGSGSNSGGSAPAGGFKADADPTPTFPAPKSLDPDLVARAAAVIGSCMPDDGVARNATHLWLAHLAAPRLYFRFGEQLDCLANAGQGCAAVEHCLSWRYDPAPANCSGSCQGDVFKGCGDEIQVTVDCSRLGLSCDPAANCVAEPAVACDGSTAPSCTSDGDVQFCDDGALRKTPCAAQGFACVDGACQGQGSPCTANSSTQSELAVPRGTSCSGDVLLGCLGGFVAPLDCSEQGPGFSCQSLGDAFFCGQAAECVPADNYLSDQSATCDGNVLTFCSAGRLEHLDCTTLGFTGCEVNTKLGNYGCTPSLGIQ